MVAQDSFSSIADELELGSRKAFAASRKQPIVFLFAVAVFIATAFLLFLHFPGKHEKERLADGCAHVYLDVGANIGMHERFLFEKELYPATQAMQGYMDSVFGVATPRSSICTFGFEGNPKHDDRLESLEKCYNDVMGYRTKFFRGTAVVGGAEKNVTFCFGNDEAQEFWGAGIDNR